MSDWTLADAVRRDDELSGDWECGCDTGATFVSDAGVCLVCGHPLTESVQTEHGWVKCVHRVPRVLTADQLDRRELLALVRELVGRETALLQRLGDVYWPEFQNPLFWAELLDSEWQEMSRIQYGLRRAAQRRP